MAESTSAVAIFDTHTAAEKAIKALNDASFNMKQLSIVGKDYHTEEHAVGFYNSPGGVVIGRVWTDHGKPDALRVKAGISVANTLEKPLPYLKVKPAAKATAGVA